MNQHENDPADHRKAAELVLGMTGLSAMAMFNPWYWAIKSTSNGVTGASTPPGSPMSLMNFWMNPYQAHLQVWLKVMEGNAAMLNLPSPVGAGKS
jgi:hypothetical protein